MFIAFFGYSLVDYHIVPNSFRLLTEGSIYFLLILSILICGKNKRNFTLHLFVFYFIFVLSAICSALINAVDGYNALLSIRLVLRFYLLYLAIINIDMEEAQLYRFNKVLIFLFIIQLPAQAIKFYFFGIGEDTIGTYATHGGGVTTILPLLAIGYLIAYYYLFKKRVVYLILSIGFIVYGIIGAKLALLFLYPIAFISLYYLNVVRLRGLQIPGDVYKVIIIISLSIIIGSAIIKFQPRANRERVVGGSIDLSYTLKYTKKYTTGRNTKDPGITTGRLSTTKITLKYLWEDGIKNFYFGYGPGTIVRIKSGKINKINTNAEKIVASYGHTGAVYILTEYGIFGIIILIIVYTIFIKNCWRLYNIEKEAYWKAYASGSLFFALISFFIFLTYNTETSVGDIITPVFFYCMAIAYSRLKAIKKRQKFGIDPSTEPLMGGL